MPSCLGECRCCCVTTACSQLLSQSTTTLTAVTEYYNLYCSHRVLQPLLQSQSTTTFTAVTLFLSTRYRVLQTLLLPFVRYKGCGFLSTLHFLYWREISHKIGFRWGEPAV